MSKTLLRTKYATQINSIDCTIYTENTKPPLRVAVFWWRCLLQVDLVLNDQREYENGNALVVKISLIEMECTNFLKIVDLW
ncbi:MAG: hypothetical protein ACI92I_000337 [Acidimicrobiales bacterium]|jgi:hypothetical protein